MAETRRFGKFATLAFAATALGAHTTELYEAFSQMGEGGSDFSAIINMIRERG